MASAATVRFAPIAHNRSQLVVQQLPEQTELLEGQRLSVTAHEPQNGRGCTTAPIHKVIVFEGIQQTIDEERSDLDFGFRHSNSVEHRHDWVHRFAVIGSDLKEIAEADDAVRFGASLGQIEIASAEMDGVQFERLSCGVDGVFAAIDGRGAPMKV